MDSVAKRVDKIDCILRSIFDETNDENVREVKGTYDFDQYENALTNQNVDMIGEQMGLSDGSYDRYTKDIGVDIELGFRSYLDSLLVPSVNAATTIMKLAKYEHVLKFAISVALRYGSGHNDTAHGSTNASESLKDTTPVTPSALISLYRIPFLLIEDILEGETIANIEKFWIVLENLISIITVPELFSRGKLVILRACNSLLRKLSKSCKTEFCGRILMFLAAIYPLTERSAMNLSGKINSASIAKYDDKEHFLSPKLTIGKETVVEMEQSEENIDSKNEVRSVKDTNEHGIDYNSYKGFWSLQEYLYGTYDLKELTTPNANGEIAISKFVKYCNIVCTEFEKYKYEPKDLIQTNISKQKMVVRAIACTGSEEINDSERDDGMEGSVETALPQDTAANGRIDHLLGCKYLTSSQLYHLELLDPNLRLQMCSQILMFLYNIKARGASAPPSQNSTSGSKPPPPGLDISAYCFDEKDSSNNNNATGTGNKNSSTGNRNSLVVKNEQKSASIVQSLRNVEYRVIHILENCAIGGKSFAKLLYDTLVHREKRWIDWKLASCPSFEKYAQKHNSNLVELKEAIETGSETGTGADRGKKRKREPEFAGNHTFHYGYNNAQVAAITRQLVSKVPTFEEIIELYRDAEDPEAGIEEEYHPKHNSVYCWRVRRLMVSQASKLKYMHFMQDGNIGEAVKVLFPNSIPSE